LLLLLLLLKYTGVEARAAKQQVAKQE